MLNMTDLLRGINTGTPTTSDLAPFVSATNGAAGAVTIANLATLVLAQPAVTASPGDNDTSVATTAFVTAAIEAALEGGSPGATAIDLITEVAQTSIVIAPANITGFSATLTAGAKYVGRLVAFVSNALAADGARFDFDGTATWTEFRAAIVSNVQGATLSVTTSTAIETDLIATALADTNPHCIIIEFAGLVNAGGTFIPRFAKEADAAGATLSLLPGSHFDVTQVPS